MNFRKRKISRASPRSPEPTSRETALQEKVNICLCLSEFLRFEDFRSLVRTVWPNNDECDIIRWRMWQLSTHIAEIPFINGTHLSIEFNYNPWRKNQDCILINVETLLPIFGKIMWPAVNVFTSVSQIENFVKMHVHLNRCSDYRHSSCSCHLKNSNPHEAGAFAKPRVDECKFGHLHHYCAQHVSHWLKFFLHPLLAAKTQNNSPEKNDMECYLSLLSNIITF
ncbi:repeat element 23 [Diadegma semiclausum ichnovirus]|nr:repeat element 23 [Diadegma semiclausum ichnovirus]